MTRVVKGSLTSVYFDGLEQWIEDNRNSRRQVNWAMDRIVMGYAYIALGEAQRLSAGPLDPRGNRGGGSSGIQARGTIGGKRTGANSLFSARRYKGDPAAWKIPVRRMTEQYFLGWKVQKVGQRHYRLINESREAYFIEFGINHRGTGLSDGSGNRVRIRRPILKKSVLAAMTFAHNSHFDQSNFNAIFAAQRGQTGHAMGEQVAGLVTHSYIPG